MKLASSTWYTTCKGTKQGKRNFSIFSYTIADWQDLKKHINEIPFQTYRFSNVNLLVDQFYDWLYEIFWAHIPMKTKHRRSLSRWVKSETSNLVKQMNTLRRQIGSKPSRSKMDKLKQMSHHLDSQFQRDQYEFQRKVFQAGNFSEIQKYLKSIRRRTQLPSEQYL